MNNNPLGKLYDAVWDLVLGSPFAFILSILALLFVLMVVSWQLESAAYNRLTGANTTIWDAAVLELRVTGDPK